jgi:hypothetical protein
MTLRPQPLMAARVMRPPTSRSYGGPRSTPSKTPQNIRQALSLALLLLVVGSASYPAQTTAAKDYFVSATGNDASSCTSQQDPCRTIRRAGQDSEAFAPRRDGHGGARELRGVCG